MYKTNSRNTIKRRAAWLIVIAMLAALIPVGLWATHAAGDPAYNGDLITGVAITGDPRSVTMLAPGDAWITTNLAKIQAASPEDATAFCVWKVDGTGVGNTGNPITVTATVGDDFTVSKMSVLIFDGNINMTGTAWDQLAFQSTTSTTISRGTIFNQPRDPNIGYYVYIYSGVVFKLYVNHKIFALLYSCFFCRYCQCKIIYNRY